MINNKRFTDRFEILAYPYGYKYILFLVYILHPIHIYTAYRNNYIKCCIFDILLMLSSINYWRNPILKSNRRKIDIIIAVSNILYHSYISKNKTFLFGTLLYPINTFLYKYNYIYTSIICHCLLHISISTSAIFYYIK